MHTRILKILSGIIFLFTLSVVVASHVWVRSSLQEQILKKTEAEFPEIVRAFSKASKTKRQGIRSFVRFLEKNYPGAELRLWNFEFDLIFPKKGVDPETVKSYLYQNIENLRQAKIKNKRYIYFSGLNNVDIFLKVEIPGNACYLSIRSPVLSENALIFLGCLYGFVLLFMGLIWFIGLKLSGNVVSILQALTRSMESFSKNKYAKTIQYDRDNEIGDLVSAYNDLTHNIQLALNGTDLPETSPQPEATRSPQPLPGTEDIEVFLPKTDFIEISMFPNTLANNPDLTIAFEKAGDQELHLLILHTQTSEPEGYSWRNTMREHFKELVLEAYEPEKIVSELLGSANKNEQLLPGVFYGYFDPENKEMSLFGTGRIAGFAKGQTDAFVPLDIAALKIPTQFKGFDKKEFSPKGLCVLFFSEMLQNLGISNTDFENEILPVFSSDNRSGKNLLKQALERILAISPMEPSALKNMQGFLILIAHKP